MAHRLEAYRFHVAVTSNSDIRQVCLDRHLHARLRLESVRWSCNLGCIPSLQHWIDSRQDSVFQCRVSMHDFHALRLGQHLRVRIQVRASHVEHKSDTWLLTCDVALHCRQVDAGPPSIVLMCRNSKKTSPGFEHMMQKSLRNRFNLHGVPIKILIRSDCDAWMHCGTMPKH